MQSLNRRLTQERNTRLLLDALNRAFEAYLRFKDERDPASWDKEFVADVRKLLRVLAKECDALLEVRGGNARLDPRVRSLRAWGFFSATGRA